MSVDTENFKGKTLLERPSAHLDCSAGLTFAFAYAASETSASGVAREFMKYDSFDLRSTLMHLDESVVE